MKAYYRTIIIGAGQFGISLSCKLQDLEHDHIVLEKDSIGSTWIKQRWDSFRLVTPKKMNTIEENDNYFSSHNEYLTAQEFQKYLIDKAIKRNLPIFENYELKNAIKNRKGQFELRILHNGTELNLTCQNLVVASGSLNEKFIPEFNCKLPNEINQKHSSEYKNLNDIQIGRTIVVGSGQSGMQLAKEISTKSNVILLTSKVGTIPRSYLGQNIEEWFINLKSYEKTYSCSSIDERKATNPNVINESNNDILNNDIELASSLKDLTTNELILNTDLDSNLSFQKNYYNSTLLEINNKLKRKESAELKTPRCPYLKNYITTLNLKENNVKNIIWATGFKAKFSFLELDVFDNMGQVIHVDGISKIQGLYFLGLPWMRKRKSGIIYGVEEDSSFIAEKLSR